MILICPICATRYQLDDPDVTDGCAVQCAACGHGWKVLAQPQDEVAPPSGAYDDQPPLADTPLPQAQLGRTHVESMRREAEEALRLSSPQHSYRHRQKTRHHRLVVLATAAPWMCAAGLVLIAVSASLIWRSDIMYLWPDSVRVYALFGLGSADSGFTLRDLTVERDASAADTAIVVRGRAVNKTGNGHPPPLVDITLVDREGHDLHTYRVHIDSDRIAPGAHGEFALRIDPVPETAHSVDVRFEKKSVGTSDSLPPDSGQHEPSDTGGDDHH